MDALSEVLRLSRFGASVTLDATAHAPWCVSLAASASPPKNRDAVGFPKIRDAVGFPEIRLRPGFLSRAHVVVEGRAVLAIAGEAPIALEDGDLVLLPHGDAHVIGSDPDIKAVSINALGRNVVASEMVPVRIGGDGPVARWIALDFSCERHLAQPLLDLLPRAVRVPMAGAPALNALVSSLGLTLSASDAPTVGAGLRRDTLATLLLVEALRRYVTALAPRGKGWLEGLNDRYVGRALALVHGRPGEPWTVEKLGRQVGLSRSALAERFSDVMGEPIFAFLTRWRLQLAAEHLLTTPRPIDSIAKEAGYESASAFSSAFKRQFRKPPSIWRRMRHGR